MAGIQVRSWNEVRGVWAIVYEIDPTRRTEYLDWFHAVHIPEKLERPGYLKAAHYRITGPDPVSGNGYVAIFGATDTRVFLDPSPGQLKLRQDDLTRQMVGHRRGTQHLVLAEEWRAAGSQAIGASNASGAPVISLRLFDAGGSDDAVGAWYAQELPPVLARTEGCLRMRKLLASIGEPRHALLCEYETTAVEDTVASALPLRPQTHTTAPKFPVVAERVWPE